MTELKTTYDLGQDVWVITANHQVVNAIVNYVSVSVSANAEGTTELIGLDKDNLYVRSEFVFPTKEAALEYITATCP